jgi:hypothetical protein
MLAQSDQGVRMPIAMSDSEREQFQKTVNDSGFPLQMGIKLLVQSAASAMRWRASLSEHPWDDPLSDDPKFIDLVIRGRQEDDPLRLVIECKRARDTEWLFLRQPPIGPRSNFRLNVKGRIFVQHQSALMNHWEDSPFTPGSPQADYCVVRKNKGRSDDLVEKPAAEIVRAVDALAMQEFQLYSRGNLFHVSTSTPITRLFIPMIVTTAKMYICDADYQNINLETGEISGANIEPVDFVRFAKSFGAGDARRAGDITIEKFAEQTERSVLIVQASAFLDFLGHFDIGRDKSNTRILDALYPKRTPFEPPGATQII